MYAKSIEGPVVKDSTTGRQMHTRIPGTEQGIYSAILHESLPIRQLIVSKVCRFRFLRVKA